MLLSAPNMGAERAARAPALSFLFPNACCQLLTGSFIFLPIPFLEALSPSIPASFGEIPRRRSPECSPLDVPYRFSLAPTIPVAPASSAAAAAHASPCGHGGQELATPLTHMLNASPCAHASPCGHGPPHPRRVRAGPLHPLAS